MPPKLVTLTANYLAGPFSQSVNNSIRRVISRKYNGCLSYSHRQNNMTKTLCLNFPNKCFKLFLKSLRKHIKNTNNGKNEQFVLTFHPWV